MEKIDLYMREFLARLEHESIFEYYNQINHGKRLRSLLMLSISNHPDIYKLCAIVECIHLASLLHDDVIDGASIRRGKPSINAVFGDKSAIMLGDILYSAAFYELCEYDKDISRTIANAVSVLSSGELLDVELSMGFCPDMTKYQTMIYRKTAVLIESSAKAAALLEKKNADKYATYGKNLGMAFQIIDDLIDVSVEQDMAGKPVFADFSEGKTSMPYILLYDALDEPSKARLKSLHKKIPSTSDKEWLKECFEKFGIYQKVKTMALEYANAAKQSIQSEQNTKLEQIIQKMVDRSF